MRLNTGSDNMAKVTSLKITDNSKALLKAYEGQLLRALEAVGLQAEGYAQLELENDPRRIDTGLLRNSITHAIDGEKPAKTNYQSNAKDKHGNRIERKSGAYHGSTPSEGKNKRCVYIGTNVEYAPYVEYGTQKMTANHFIRNSVEKYAKEYKEIFKKYFKG